MYLYGRSKADIPTKAAMFRMFVHYLTLKGWALIYHLMLCDLLFYIKIQISRYISVFHDIGAEEVSEVDVR